jgi:hypothetical protein
MLWEAGQIRVHREGRQRLSELYVGIRDGYVAGRVATGAARWSGGGDHTPVYARGDDYQPQTKGGQRATLARLASMFPGAVRRLDS